MDYPAQLGPDLNKIGASTAQMAAPRTQLFGGGGGGTPISAGRPVTPPTAPWVIPRPSPGGFAVAQPIQPGGYRAIDPGMTSEPSGFGVTGAAPGAPATPPSLPAPKMAATAATTPRPPATPANPTGNSWVTRFAGGAPSKPAAQPQASKPVAAPPVANWQQAPPPMVSPWQMAGMGFGIDGGVSAAQQPAPWWMPNINFMPTW
jgi:hypothetical protein